MKGDTGVKEQGVEKAGYLKERGCEGVGSESLHGLGCVLGRCLQLISYLLTGVVM